MATYKYFSYDNFLYFWQKMKLKIQAMNTAARSCKGSDKTQRRGYARRNRLRRLQLQRLHKHAQQGR